jgi:hypothetical protein
MERNVLLADVERVSSGFLEAAGNLRTFSGRLKLSAAYALFNYGAESLFARTLAGT